MFKSKGAIRQAKEHVVYQFDPDGLSLNNAVYLISLLKLDAHFELILMMKVFLKASWSVIKTKFYWAH